VRRTASGRAFVAATAAVVTVGVVLPFVFDASRTSARERRRRTSVAFNQLKGRVLGRRAAIGMIAVGDAR